MGDFPLVFAGGLLRVVEGVVICWVGLIGNKKGNNVGPLGIKVVQIGGVWKWVGEICVKA